MAHAGSPIFKNFACEGQKSIPGPRGMFSFQCHKFLRTFRISLFVFLFSLFVMRVIRSAMHEARAAPEG